MSVCGLLVLVLVILAVGFVGLDSSYSPSLFPIRFLATVIILPGILVDAIASGNIHGGYGNPYWEAAVMGVGSWIFWMLLALLIAFNRFLRKKAKNKK